MLLVGEGAQAFAEAQGVPRLPDSLHPEMAAEFAEWQRGNRELAARTNIENPLNNSASNHDTIGMLVFANGVLAGSCTTSGRAFKLPGRVGDSPIIGAGSS